MMDLLMVISAIVVTPSLIAAMRKLLHPKKLMNLCLPILLLLVSASVAQAKADASYIVVIEDGRIKVCDVKGNEVNLGVINMDDFIKSYEHQPPFHGQTEHMVARHLALDAVAARIAGNGIRDHSVAPDEQVVTFEEATAALAVTLTMKKGTSFFILRDSMKKCEDTCHGTRYRAEIGMLTKEQISEAPKLSERFFSTATASVAQAFAATDAYEIGETYTLPLLHYDGTTEAFTGVYLGEREVSQTMCFMFQNDHYLLFIKKNGGEWMLSARPQTQKI